MKVTYTYDSLNQLEREDNAYLNKTITYSYDLGGNLTSTQEYAYLAGLPLPASVSLCMTKDSDIYEKAVNTIRRLWK
ncbi:MAG: hypothetical protein J5496_06795 [Lachnospiraceae bacterium]|nr:hypothetical protein [Lachnospiraceae bacterium]